METIGIILSGKYCNFEIGRLYGELPPSFLPHLGQRLFVSQVAHLRKFCTKVFLTIPAGYELTPIDKEKLLVSDVELIWSNPKDSINEALIKALRTIENKSKAVMVLYGDTLIDDEIPINSVAIYRKPDKYSWGRNQGIAKYEQCQFENIEMMMAGLFYLRDSELLSKSISESDGSILNTLDIYSEVETLKYQRVNIWSDFGHLGTLQKANLRSFESRYFNEVKITELGVTKQSTDVKKLHGEVAWYKKVPSQFRRYVPKLITETENQYTIEYIPSPTIYELLVYGNLSLSQWINIFDELCNFFLEANKYSESTIPISLTDLLKIKTEERGKSFLSTKPNFKDFDFSELERIFSQQNVNLLLEKVKLKDSKHLGFIHGDLCATNIFWDGASKSLKFVDPRGDTTGRSTGIYGDIRYDIGKLYHSFILGYDSVLAGFNKYQQSEMPDSSMAFSFSKYCKIEFNKLFQEKLFEPLQLHESEIKSISTLLMLGLVPLHADRMDHQNEFIHIVVESLKDLS